MKTIGIKHLKINSSLIDVEYVKKLVREDGRPLLGRIWYDHGLVRINKKFPSLTQLKTLFHEATHGINDEFTLDLEEGEIDILSKAFYAFIVYNPKFIRKILGFAAKRRKK